MVKRLPRLLLGLAAVLLFLSGLFHASGYKRILAALANTNLEPFAANSLKILWLVDSAVLIISAAVFALVAIRPSSAMRSVLVLLALIPAATAALIYVFIGSFIGAHMVMAAAIIGLVGGLQYPKGSH